MHRFFVEPGQVSENEIAITDPGDVKHMTRVLRAEPGDRVEVSDRADWEYVAEVTRVEPDSVFLRILDKQGFAREPDLQITLFQGIPRAAKMDSVVQKSVELGVREIVPVFCARTVVTDSGNMGKKAERWRKISAEAVKQCRRGIVPSVADAMDFPEVPQALAGFDVAIFPYENERERSLKDCLRNLAEKPKSLAVVIGPEGGFSDAEARDMRQAGAVSVSLGKTILRTETAGPAALAMILYELEL
ncbi:MAG: 16S rRNA (uracil(1498)-N(3))-methyltransferase [Clostridiales Family XIII bacterium]|jgi:16S rRNA (uracil1498-N3)-methyltransferase|nr:16S rRNA (uracil(1498)-N(3))-methyltransferase [Clostridiales Family XIII bacterium]